MKHAREDYQRYIVDVRRRPFGQESPNIKPEGIPDDEPVFLLRAQDPLAAETVKYYADRLYQRARNGGDLAFARLAERHAALMTAWPVKKEFPDAPGVNDLPTVAMADRRIHEAPRTRDNYVHRDGVGRVMKSRLDDHVAVADAYEQAASEPIPPIGTTRGPNPKELAED